MHLLLCMFIIIIMWSVSGFVYGVEVNAQRKIYRLFCCFMLGWVQIWVASHTQLCTLTDGKSHTLKWYSNTLKKCYLMHFLDSQTTRISLCVACFLCYYLVVFLCFLCFVKTMINNVPPIPALIFSLNAWQETPCVTHSCGTENVQICIII